MRPDELKCSSKSLKIDFSSTLFVYANIEPESEHKKPTKIKQIYNDVNCTKLST